MVVMLFELIGLKIIFDVDLRDVGKTPLWDRDIPSSHQQWDGQEEAVWKLLYLPG